MEKATFLVVIVHALNDMMCCKAAAGSVLMKLLGNFQKNHKNIVILIPKIF